MILNNVNQCKSMIEWINHNQFVFDDHINPSNTIIIITVLIVKIYKQVKTLLQALFLNNCFICMCCIIIDHI